MRPTLDIDASVATDPGCLRPENQDTVCYVRPGDPFERQRRGVLAIVADGMGGHRGGQIASALAVQAIRTHFLDTEAEEPLTVLKQAFERANDVVYARATRDEQVRGMGTTATALVIRGQEAWVAHVGDSRAYRCTAGDLTQLTDDDTLVRMLVRDGTLSEEEARNHPDRNLLVNALGTKPSVQVAVTRCREPVREGDTFVLCSDGLHDVVSREEIAARANSLTAQKACEQLLALALERGASDNVSVIVLSVRPQTDAWVQPITREIPGVP